jgi:hypothetical protein
MTRSFDRMPGEERDYAMKLLKSGDEVAVLPHNAAPPREVLDIDGCLRRPESD